MDGLEHIINAANVTLAVQLAQDLEPICVFHAVERIASTVDTASPVAPLDVQAVNMSMLIIYASHVWLIVSYVIVRRAAILAQVDIIRA
jgi:hypothetical protein